MKKTKAGYVAIIGRPNSGKSTLLNGILGTEISIVSPKAQTTRERVLGIYTEKNEQIVFVDTPGIHQADKGGMNEFMVNEAEKSFQDSDVVWYLVDPLSEVFHEEIVIEKLTRVKLPIFLIWNKSDLKEERLAFVAELKEKLAYAHVKIEAEFTISGLKKKGVKELLEKTSTYLKESEFFYPDAEALSDRPLKFFVAEKIRANLFLALGEELPYSCAVLVREYKEKKGSDGLTRILASIIVERDSQKGMVIGVGGKKIKEIGMNSRAQIEKFLQEKIFLGLEVEVKKNWTRDAKLMREIGFKLEKSS